MHPAWGPYPDTLLHFPEADLIVDLRREISPHTWTALARLGFEGPFAVVTACNPLGRSAGEPANLRLSALLSAVVRWRYPGARPAHGAAASGTHFESGWALPVSLEEARELAARFFQMGIFWFDGDRFFIEPVLAPGPALALPVGAAQRSRAQWRNGAE